MTQLKLRKIPGYTGQAQAFFHDNPVEEIAEIQRHGNTLVCPPVADLYPTQVGCEYRCTYCNAWAMGNTATFEPIIVPIHYPQKVRQFIDSNPEKNMKMTYYLAPKTDVFAPALIDSGITAKILEVFDEKDVQYVVVTKGGKISREIEELLFKTRRKGQVNITQAMPNEKIRQLIEPSAPTIEQRYALAKKLKEKGIRVAGMIEPIIPSENLDYIENIMNRFLSFGVDHFAIEIVKLTQVALTRICKILPSSQAKFMNKLYNSPDSLKYPYKTPFGENVVRIAPPMSYVRETFSTLKELAQSKGATGSICNQFGWPLFNREAQARGYNCMAISRL